MLYTCPKPLSDPNSRTDFCNKHLFGAWNLFFRRINFSHVGYLLDKWPYSTIWFPILELKCICCNDKYNNRIFYCKHLFFSYTLIVEESGTNTELQHTVFLFGGNKVTIHGWEPFRISGRWEMVFIVWKKPSSWISSSPENHWATALFS